MSDTDVRQHAEVKGEIARSDNKIALLLAFDGALLAGVVSVARDVQAPPAASVVGGIGVGFLLVGMGLLLAAVRPDLSGRHGVPLWATQTPQEIKEAAGAVDLAADVAGLSRLAVAKFRRLQRAVDCTRMGGGLLVVAALVRLVGGIA